MTSEERIPATVQFAPDGRVGGGFPPCLDKVPTPAPALQVQVYALVSTISTTTRLLDHLATKVSGNWPSFLHEGFESLMRRIPGLQAALHALRLRRYLPILVFQSTGSDSPCAQNPKWMYNGRVRGSQWCTISGKSAFLGRSSSPPAMDTPPPVAF